MRHRTSRTTSAALVILAFLTLGASPSWAESKKKGDAGVVSTWIGDRLEEVFELVDQNKYKETLPILKEMEGRPRLSDIELATIHKTYGQIYAGLEQYKKSTASLEKCLTYDALPAEEQLTIKYTIAQMYMIREDFKKALRMLRAWIAEVENPSSDGLMTVATAYRQNKQYKSALTYLKRALAMVEKPPQSWLEQKLFLHYELRQRNDTVATLKQLLILYPKADHWIRLAQTYTDLNDHDRALAAMEVAYRGGYITDKDYLLNLARMYLARDVPAKAGELLEFELKNGRVPPDGETYKILASAWLQARESERALGPLHQAAQAEKDPYYYIQIAQVHLDRQRWAKGRIALESALSMGGLDDPGHAYLLLGIANLSDKKFAAARKALQKAREYEGVAATASQWLGQVEAAQSRAAMLSGAN